MPQRICELMQLTRMEDYRGSGAIASHILLYEDLRPAFGPAIISQTGFEYYFVHRSEHKKTEQDILLRSRP